MTDPIRWGILGASNFAKTDMAPALHMARGSRLVALATRSADKAAPFVNRVPDLRVETAYDALLSAEDIDAVYIPLPNHLHVEWAVKALKAGKHVLCEKPMGLHADDFDTLIAERDAARTLAAEAYMIVHHPQWQRTKDLLAAGAIGRLMHVEAVFTYNDPDPDNVRNKPNMGGGGLRDIGVYTFGSARFATGQEPETLTSSLRMQHDFDTFAEINAAFPDFTYHAIVSTRMAPRQRVVFHGDEGTLELTAPFNANVFDQAEVVLETRQKRSADGQGITRTVERWPGVDQYVLQVEAFCESARSGATYPWTLEDARGTQAMIDSAIAGG